MNCSQLAPIVPILYGRQGESLLFARLLDRARQGHGDALILHGTPGIGKTALLEHLRAQATDFRVLLTAGAEFEMSLAFAAAHQMFVSLLDELDRISSRPREAVERAFALRDGEPESSVVGHGLSALASRAAGERPLLCIIDDAQWLDPASAHVLSMMARNLAAERILMVFAVRELVERPELTDLPAQRISGLTRESAAELLGSPRQMPLDPRVRDRIIVEADGNPRALLQPPFPADIKRGASGFTPQQSLPVERESLGRMRTLSADSRTLLLVAAADPTGDPILLKRAAVRLGVGETAMGAVVSAGLLEISDLVRFRPSAIRSAIYQEAAPPARRAAHQALAEVIDAERDADCRAWHRALATLGQNEQVAAELESTVDQARVCGGAVAAAAFLALAASLTSDPRRLGERALAAARARRELGDMDGALTLLDMGDPHHTDPTAAVERAGIQFATRRDAATHHDLLHLIRAHPERAEENLLDAFAVVIASARCGPAQGSVGMARAIRARAADHSMDPFLAAFATRTLDGHTPASPLMRLALAARHGPAHKLAALAALDLWDFARWRRLTEIRVESARRSGAITDLVDGLYELVLIDTYSGDPAAAEKHLDESHVALAVMGQTPVSVGDLLHAAWTDDEKATTGLLESVLKTAERAREGRQITLAEYAQAVRLNGLCRYDAALAVLRTAIELDEPGLMPFVATEFLEAAARTGRNDLAAPVLERLERHTRTAGTDWAVGLHACARAQLTAGPAAEPWYREAVERLSRTPATTCLARAQLVYGEWLRREGRKGEAGAQLRAAHKLLTASRAGTFAARAARELRANGESMADGVRRATQLTPQEENIARLAAAGATSKEIGLQLFLSQRTVDAHLRSVFKKLDLTSRRQLKDMEF
ncbi:AAA family ATPase [Nonomuraea sp. NPDC052265]|uniref:AAA family ATPase n=1 Tax=Nonomuraea sp. NPDC052265 TaxID=3364374 RepID=UPI0037CB739D